MRIKRGKARLKRRKHILEDAKGFKWGRKSKLRAAKEALLHARYFAYRDRKKKKSEFRKLWNIKIGAATKQMGLSYSKFIFGMKKANIVINRKMLADLAQNHPESFKAVVLKAKSALKL
jgi:large subunit ribosomal protein L20